MSAILYLHGFLSSPKSNKAQMTQQWLQLHRPDLEYICPSLPALPKDCEEYLQQLVGQRKSQKIFVIGSSLGGLWATMLIERDLVTKSVLINPAVRPALRFQEFIDKPLKNYYSDEVVELNKADIDYLNNCEYSTLAYPEKYWVMLQTGDETLDYRLAQEKYKKCRCLIEQGGNHTFEGYENWLSNIIEFFES